MFHVYIIRSGEGRFYVGSTDDIATRLQQHRSKQYRGWTNRFDDWQLVYSEDLATRTEAIVREREIKRMKGGIRFKALVRSLGS